jgi:hypothetical protein
MKNSSKIAKKCILYDPMLRRCNTCAWAWKKTIGIKQKNTKKINFEMVSNLSKFWKKWFFKNFVITHTKIKFNFSFNTYSASAYP